MSQSPGDFKVKKGSSKPKWHKWQTDFANACKKVSKEPGYYNRLIRLRDSHDAGGSFMAESDGDFIWLCGVSRAFLVEAKFSEVHETLMDGLNELVPKRQRNCHLAWNMMGHGTLIVFRSELAEVFEVWDAAALFGGKKAEESVLIASFEDTKNNLEEAVRKIARTRRRAQ